MKRPARKPAMKEKAQIEAVPAEKAAVEVPKSENAAEDASSRSRQNDGPVLKRIGSWKAGPPLNIPIYHKWNVTQKAHNDTLPSLVMLG